MKLSIDVQLLNEWNGHTIPDDAVVEPKIDGVRAIFIFAGDRFCCLSRKGNTLNNVSHIAAELIDKFDGWVLDGELVADDFSSTVSTLHRSENGDMDARFIVFDALTVDEFDSRTCDRPLDERRKTLERMLPKRLLFTSLLKQKRVRSISDVEAAMKTYVKQGFEGAVMKDLDSFYSFKRGSDWVKVKPFKSGDFKIVSIEEGKGRLKGTMGKIYVKGPKGKVSGVGTGFDDAERARFWKQRQKLIGKIAEVKYQEIASSGGLRFPSFMRLRGDKS